MSKIVLLQPVSKIDDGKTFFKYCVKDYIHRAAIVLVTITKLPAALEYEPHDCIRICTHIWPGTPIEEWEVPFNKLLLIPKYLYEQIERVRNERGEYLYKVTER